MKKTKLMFSMAFVFTSLISFISAHTGNDSYTNYSMMGNSSWGVMWFFGWIFMVLIVVALILFIVWLIKQISEPQKKKRK